MVDCKQAAVPDPQLVGDVYLRQVLVPLRKNQQVLAQCIAECCGAEVAGGVASSQARSKFPVRALGKPDLVGSKVGGQVGGVSLPAASDLDTAIALVNECKAVLNAQAGVINQLLQAQSDAIDDRDALAEQLKKMQAKNFLQVQIRKVSIICRLTFL